MKKKVSVIIRTLNESLYLEELIIAIRNQDTSIYNIEVVIVDSGSTDQTISIAKKYDCVIKYIKKEEFTFGRSLNYGCEIASGEFFVFISGHCIPLNNEWINNLVSPLESHCSYTYGKQVGRDSTKFSERQLFLKYFPDKSSAPQVGFFCNNANAAIKKEAWQKYQFNEELTGCEDMYMAKKLVDDNCKIGYIAEASVYHIHDESWRQVRIRYEREAIALRKILPEINISIIDTAKYIFVGIFKDFIEAFKRKVFFKEFFSIILFRIAQYIGSYTGNKKSFQTVNEIKERYFYPRVTSMEINKSE